MMQVDKHFPLNFNCKKMKKILVLLSAAVITLTLNSFSKKENGEPNKEIINTFKADFPSAENVIWTIDQNVHVARFVNNGRSQLAYYSFDGEYLGQIWRITLDETPANVKTEILKNITSEQVKIVNLFFPPEGYPKYVAIITVHDKKIIKQVDSYGQSSIVLKKRIPIL
jgi:hypothetical protein